MRKIFLMVLFIINMYPCLNDKGEFSFSINTASAQDESGEFYCYDEDDWPNTSGNGSSGHTNTYHDEPDAYDPTNDPDWGYPDWSEWEDWMNFLDETEMNPYRYENLWPGVVDSSLKRYYVTIDMNPERYYNNSKHSFVKRSAKIRLLLGLEGEALTRPGLSWTVNGLAMPEAANMDSLYLRGDTTTTYRVSVFKNSSWVMSFEVSIFGKPVVYFRKKDNYKGEYGFDDVGYQYDSLKNDYKKIKIDSSNYNVPWMSLLDSQTATVKIAKLLPPGALANSSLRVKFKPTHKNIKINGADSLHNISMASLQTMDSLRIYSREWDTARIKSYSKQAILVIANNNDTIGRLDLSCQRQDVRKIIFVNVNTGTGYRSFDKQAFVDSINAISHNQIFRKWVVDSSNSVNGLDTLDATAEFLADATGRFMRESWVLNNVQNIYFKHKDIHIRYDLNNEFDVDGNDARKIHVFFMFNYSLPLDADSSVTLAAAGRGGYIAVGWNRTWAKTIAHELGHLLSLNHTFPDLKSDGTTESFNYNIPKGSTKNYMDYVNNEDMFFYRQWRTSY